MHNTRYSYSIPANSSSSSTSIGAAGCVSTCTTSAHLLHKALGQAHISCSCSHLKSTQLIMRRCPMSTVMQRKAMYWFTCCPGVCCFTNASDSCLLTPTSASSSSLITLIFAAMTRFQKSARKRSCSYLDAICSKNVLNAVPFLCSIQASRNAGMHPNALL